MLGICWGHKSLKTITTRCSLPQSWLSACSLHVVSLGVWIALSSTACLGGSVYMIFEKHPPFRSQGSTLARSCRCRRSVGTLKPNIASMLATSKKTVRNKISLRLKCLTPIWHRPGTFNKDPLQINSTTWRWVKTTVTFNLFQKNTSYISYCTPFKRLSWPPGYLPPPSFQGTEGRRCVLWRLQINL